MKERASGRGRARVEVWACCLAAVLAAGCYRYEPVELPRPGTEVRARLKVEAAVKRSQDLDEPIRNMSGAVVGLHGDTLALDVLVARANVGLREVVLRDTVALALAEVEQLTERRLAPVRTALFIAALVGGVVAIATGVEWITGGDSGGGGDDGGTRAIVTPVFTLGWQGGAFRVGWPLR